MHDMCRFLIADLGILRYPQYMVRRTRAVWPDRRSLLAYEAALRHAELLDNALEVGSYCTYSVTLTSIRQDRA